MRRNRIKFVIIAVAIILVLIGAFVFSKLSEKNLVNDLIIDSNKYEELIELVTVWEKGENATDTNILISYPEDASYKEIQNVLSKWKVKRNYFGDTANTAKTYRIVFTIRDQPNQPLPYESIEIIVDKDGKLNIHGKEYKLVDGKIEELLELTK